MKFSLLIIYYKKIEKDLLKRKMGNQLNKELGVKLYGNTNAKEIKDNIVSLLI